MATLSANTIVKGGLDDSAVHAAAAAGGDEFGNTGREFIEVINGGGGAITVTITAQGSGHGQDYEDETISVGASDQAKIGPFSPLVFNDSNQRVQVTYSGVTSVTVAVFKLPLVPS